MEKFRTFEDPATGIMPFMPAKVVVPKSLPVRVVRALLGTMVAILRLPACLIIFLWLALFSTVASLVPIAPVRRALKRYVDFLGCRLLLFFLGFWWIPAGWEKKNTVSAKGKAEQGWPPCGDATSGTLLISNCSSYLDILYLSFRFSPVYAAVLRETNPKMKDGVIPLGLFGALYDIIYLPEQDQSKAISLAQLVDKAKKEKRGPVCVMPEGVSSNETVMLPFLPPIGGTPGLETYAWTNGVAPKTFALVFRYPFQYFSPCFTAGSLIGHLFNLTFQFYNSMEVVFLATKVSQIKAGDQGLAPSDRSEGGWASTLHAAMCKAATTPKRSVRMVMPRCGVTNESAGEIMSAVKVKRSFREAYANRGQVAKRE